MRLELCEQVFAEQATEQDIASAIAQGSRDASWSLLLEGGNVFLLAEPAGEGNALALQCGHGDELLKASAVLDDAALQALFVSFLNRDRQWRETCRWSAIRVHAAPETQGGRQSFGPRVDAPAIFGLCFVALLFVTWHIPPSWMPDGLPQSLQNPRAWIVVWFALAIPGVVVAATLLKMREVRQAAGWAKTTGTITRSELVVEHRSPGREAPRAVNLPAVRYSYRVGGRDYSGDRISIGEIADNDPRTPEILQRYAVGSSVTVFYQPRNPANSVLERDPPVGLHVVWGIVAFLGMIMFGAACWILFPDQIDRWLAPHLPDGARPHYFLFFAVAAVLSLFRVVASRQQGKQMNDWAVTPGSIVVSEVETRRHERKRNEPMSYPKIEYAYKVGTREYRGSRVNTGISISGSAWIVRRQVDKYPVGRAVTVHYNKVNPSEAVLEPQTNHIGGGLTAVIVFGFLAWYFATH